MSHLLDAALSYANAGYHVFPIYEIRDDGTCACGSECNSPGKHPRTKHGLYEATTDHGQILDWWSEWPNANVGIRTGPESKLLVLDVDPKSGGGASLDQLSKKLNGFPPTRRVHTGGGGLHLYFRYPSERIGNSVGKLAPGIDIRGDGGYVVAPPSNHASGDRYCEDPEYVESFEFPDPLLVSLRAPVVNGNGHKPVTLPGQTTPYGRAALDGETRRV